MTTIPKPRTLFGVRHWAEHSRDGTVHADTYFMALPQEQVGIMGGTTGKETILYFFDRAKRDQFVQIFGGQCVTLHHKESALVTGAAAREILQRNPRLIGRSA